MRTALYEKFGRISPSVKSAHLRYFYKDLTGMIIDYLSLVNALLSMYAYMVALSLLHTFTHSFIYAFVYSLAHSLTHSLTYTHTLYTHTHPHPHP